MKLLFDQNLSPVLVHRLAIEFPHSSHVSNLGLSSASDLEIAKYAFDNDFIICTKDSDLAEIVEMGAIRVGVVLIAAGNCSTTIVEELLRSNHEAIHWVLSKQTTSKSETFVVEL